jgi:hypothetical protein
MESQLTIRPADSPFVQAVTRWVIGDADRDRAVPDGTWDIVVLKRNGETNVLLAGQTTRAVPLQFDPGDEIVTIPFKASAFLGFISAGELLDRGILLPKTRHSFQLAADVFEIPTFDNADWRSDRTRTDLPGHYPRSVQAVDEPLHAGGHRPDDA